MTDQTTDAQELPPVPKGHKRTWRRCEEHDCTAHYDYVPYSLSNPIMVMPCGCDAKECPRVEGPNTRASDGVGDLPDHAKRFLAYMCAYFHGYMNQGGVSLQSEAANDSIHEIMELVPQEYHDLPFDLPNFGPGGEGPWKCYHCGFLATTDEEAMLHYGENEDCEPLCLDKDKHAQILATLSTSDNALREALGRAKLVAYSHKQRDLKIEVADSDDMTLLVTSLAGDEDAKLAAEIARDHAFVPSEDPWAEDDEGDGLQGAFRPMEEWDCRDEPVLLLVDYRNGGDHPIEDAPVGLTIGHNNDHNTPGEGEGWQFAGWCWSHDHYTQGKGEPIAWLPLTQYLKDKTPIVAPSSNDECAKLREALEELVAQIDLEIEPMFCDPPFFNALVRARKALAGDAS